MVRRDSGEGRLECLRLSAGEHLVRELSDTHFLYALRGESEIKVGGGTFRLSEGHGFEIEGHKGQALQVAGEDAAVIMATVSLHPAAY